jgi:iron complex outermembrane receptor protein
MLNVPVAEKVALRGSFIVGEGGGDTRNSLDGSRLNETKVGGANLKMLAEMSDTFTLELAGDWIRTNQNGRYAIDVSGILRPPSGNLYVATSGEDSRNIGKNWGLAANATWDVTDTMTIKSITSYRKTQQSYNLDLTDQPVPIYVLYTVNDSEQFSQELQISGTAFDNKLNYVAGLYYFNETSDAFIGDFLFQSLNFNKDIGVDVDSYAAFAQVDYNVTEDLTLIVGGRWTRDEKSIDFVQRLGGTPGLEPGGVVLFDTADLDGQILPSRPGKPVETDLAFNQFTPKLGIEYAVNPDLNLFATYVKGFKSGGWSARVTAANEFFNFDPEKINSYEIGTKGSILDNRGNFSLTGFYYDYSNLFNTGVNDQGAFGIATSDAEIYGIELETNWQLTEGLSAYANLSWQDAKRKSTSDATITLGEELQRLPNWQALVGFNGSHPVSDNLNVIYNASYSYMDDHYVNPQNTVSGLTGPVDLVNALVGVETADGQYRFTVGCRNCFGEEYINQILDVAALGVAVAEHVDEARDEQPRVVAGQDGVLRALDTGGAEVGEVAGHMGVLEGLGVGALEAVLVVGRHAARDRLVADQDRPALAGVGGGEDAAVARVLGQVAGADVHQVGRVDQQRHEEDEAEDRDDADGLVHRSFTTWVCSLSAAESSTGSSRGAGRRAWSEMRSRRAMTTQLATSEEPP